MENKRTIAKVGDKIAYRLDNGKEYIVFGVSTKEGDESPVYAKDKELRGVHFAHGTYNIIEFAAESLDGPSIVGVAILTAIQEVKKMPKWIIITEAVGCVVANMVYEVDSWDGKRPRIKVEDSLLRLDYSKWREATDAEVFAHVKGFHIGDKVDWNGIHKEKGLTIKSFILSGSSKGVSAHIVENHTYLCDIDNFSHSVEGALVEIGTGKALIKDGKVFIDGECITIKRAWMIIQQMKRLRAMLMDDEDIVELRLVFHNSGGTKRSVVMGQDEMSIGCVKDVTWMQVEDLEIELSKH